MEHLCLEVNLLLTAVLFRENFTILSHSRRNDDLVRLQLVKSFCMLLLTYCLGAIEVPRYKIKELAVCWNESFRKHFGYQRWKSVKKLQ